VLTAHIIYVAT